VDTSTLLKSTAKNLNLLETEKALFFIKQNFQRLFAEELSLTRVSSPLFVSKESGFQDNLNGIERPVHFNIPQLGGKSFEVVQSLAKWKRYALYRYGIAEGTGIYTDMNALRPDEEDLTSSIHSVYVDQWDWEMRIGEEARTLETLKETVKKVYRVIRDTELAVEEEFGIPSLLPREITFLHSEDLLAMYPDLTPKEREDRICREHEAVFLIGIGGSLEDGTIHDGRAPDYDDWSTGTGEGRKGLNGDILVWNPVLGRGIELSSMGIRVDSSTLVRQCDIRGCRERLEMPWHKLMLDGRLPQSIGGGIGQSRLCMFLLRKQHIGEVQVSLWPEGVLDTCEERGIKLL
jgi:aspartate--ammonia ligase